MPLLGAAGVASRGGVGSVAVSLGSGWHGHYSIIKVLQCAVADELRRTCRRCASRIIASHKRDPDPRQPNSDWVEYVHSHFMYRATSSKTTEHDTNDPTINN